MTAGGLLQPFPPPPRAVRQSIDQLAASQEWTERERADLDPKTLDRPWEPAGCPPRLRLQLWGWLDDVAAWINHEYGWQTARAIPSCWPRHPHLVHELAVVACLRLAAADATDPQLLEEWHRYVLPGFCERMTDRLGGVGCAPGKHTDWPARSRHVEFTSPQALDARNQLFEADAAADTPPPDRPPPPPPPPDPARAAVGGLRRGLAVVPDPDDEGVSR